MATEKQELNLVVNLDAAAATSALRQLQEQMKSLGTGAQAAGTERIQRTSKESTESVKQLNTEMTGIASKLGLIGGFFGGIGFEFAKFALQAVAAGTNLKAVADETVRLNNAANAVGTTSAQFRANVQVMRQSGIETAQAERELRSFADTQVDLRQRNSRVQREILSQTTPETRDVMRAQLEAIAVAPTEKALELTRQLARNVREEVTKARGAQAGAEAERSILQTLGIPSLADVRGHFAAVSAEQQKLYEGRNKPAEDLQDSANKASDAWNRIKISAESILISSGGINNNMKSGAEFANNFAGALERAEGAAQRREKLLEETPKTPQGFRDFMNKAREGQPEMRGEYQWWDPRRWFGERPPVPPEGAPPVDGQPPAPPPPVTYSWFDRARARIGRALGLPSSPEGQATAPAVPAPATPPAPVAAPPPAPRPQRDHTPHAERERERLRQQQLVTPPAVPFVGPVQVQRGGLAPGLGADEAQVYPPPVAPPVAPPAAPPVAPPAEPSFFDRARSAVGKALESFTEYNAKRLEILKGAVGKRDQELIAPAEGNAPQLPRFAEPSPFDVRPVPPPPSENEGRAANVEPSRFIQFPRSTRVEDLRPPGGGEYRSSLDPPTYSPEEEKSSWMEALKSPAGKAYFKRAETEWKPSTGTPLDTLSSGADKALIDLARQKGMSLSAEQTAALPQFAPPPPPPPPPPRQMPPQPLSPDILAPLSALTRGFSKLAVKPPETQTEGLPAQQREAWSKSVMPELSVQLDQAAAQNVNVSGSASISVDVKAPPGTTVGAEAGGPLFKSTEITRQTQMLPAEMGPMPASGVSASSGVLTNGTGG